MGRININVRCVWKEPYTGTIERDIWHVMLRTIHIPVLCVTRKLSSETHADLYLWESISLWSVWQRNNLQEPHKRHMQSHDRDNPYSSSLCRKKIIPHNCSLFGKWFILRNLKSHARKTPYQCKIKKK